MTLATTKLSITQESCDRLIVASTAKAMDLGVPMSIAVVDEAGSLKALRRMDGAPLLSVEIAINKAYTAVGFGMPTDAWFDFIKNDPPLLHGIVHTPRLIVFGGGYPVRSQGQVIGGLGLSGGHYEQDMAVGQAALDALGTPSGSGREAGRPADAASPYSG